VLNLAPNFALSKVAAALLIPQRKHEGKNIITAAWMGIRPPRTFNFKISSNIIRIRKYSNLDGTLIKN